MSLGVVNTPGQCGAPVGEQPGTAFGRQEGAGGEHGLYVVFHVPECTGNNPGAVVGLDVGKIGLEIGERFRKHPAGSFGERVESGCSDCRHGAAQRAVLLCAVPLERVACGLCQLSLRSGEKVLQILVVGHAGQRQFRTRRHNYRRGVAQFVGDLYSAHQAAVEINEREALSGKGAGQRRHLHVALAVLTERTFLRRAGAGSLGPARAVAPENQPVVRCGRKAFHVGEYLTHSYSVGGIHRGIIGVETQRVHAVFPDFQQHGHLSAGGAAAVVIYYQPAAVETGRGRRLPHLGNVGSVAIQRAERIVGYHVDQHGACGVLVGRIGLAFFVGGAGGGATEHYGCRENERNIFYDGSESMHSEKYDWIINVSGFCV